MLTRYPGYRDEALPLCVRPSPTLKVPQLDRIEVQILEGAVATHAGIPGGELDQIDVPRSCTSVCSMAPR